MNKYTAGLLICMFCCFGGCNKSSDDGIFIRIENSTSQDFKEVIANNKSFETVNSSEVSSYQLFNSVLSAPGATLVLPNNDTTYAGLVYYDWFEYLDKGKYTLTIFEDTAVISGFNCIYIKN